MVSSKLIVVTGATGAQGGGLVRAILADPARRFTVRAVTRNKDSDKARALAAEGVEVVVGDLDDVGSLKRAFKGAHGVFCVTNFWEHFSAEKEVAQARNMAEAAKAAGVAHVVWSTLEDVREFVPLNSDAIPTLGGKYKVPHFDGKGEADRLFEELPTTFVRASFYWENFIYFGMGPRRDASGKLVLNLPMANSKLTGIAAADIGKCVFGVFAAGSEMIGETIGLASDHLTGSEMAAAMSRALGESVTYSPLSFDAYRALGFPGADDLGNMFQFYCDFESEVCAARPLALSRQLNPELQNFEQWLVANATRTVA